MMSDNKKTVEEIQEFLEQLTKDAIESKDAYYSLKVAQYKSYLDLKKKDNSFKKDLLLYAIQKANAITPENQEAYREVYNDMFINTCKALVNILIRANLDYSIDELLAFFEAAKYSNHIAYWFPIGLAVSQIDKVAKKSGLTAEQQTVLKNMQNLSLGYRGIDNKNVLKIKEIIAQAQGKSLGEIEPVLLDDENEFGKKINQQVASLDNHLKIAYYQLLSLFKKSTQSKPTHKFEKEVQNIGSIVGEAYLKATIKDWLAQIKQINPVVERHTQTYTFNGGTHEYSHTTYSYLSESNLIFAKGLVWSCEYFADKESLQHLAAFAEKCFKKIPSKGPLAMGVGNACIYVLSQLGLEGVSYLSRLKLRIRQASTQSLIENYIRTSAQSLGVTPAEIEDMATPSFGLENGKLEEEFEGYKAIISIEKIGKTNLQWFKPDGTPMKSVPSIVNEQYKEALKDLKNDNAEIQKTLTVQRDRLDRSFTQDRTWTWEAFDMYYFSHGLLSFVTKKLIWIFEIEGKKYEVFYLNGQWVDLQENPIKTDNISKVKLWHPVFSSTKEVLAWRDFLAKHEIQQPLKQAYREIYLLTDAEVNTRSYSNRMAAHLLKQHQFNSLAKIRGWKYSLLGAYDKGYDTEIATIELPDNYKAEFWVQEVDADGEWNDTGIYNYVSTDQVRFYRAGEQINMVDVPPLLFSEAMRDVDLFVGVASVGNDPNWRDGGLQAYHNYWESYSFGDLTEVAKTRKQVLEHLIPRLKIAKQCQITDKFVVVKGSLRTYKIHIGSGNILMEPNDQYLCIVPDRKTEDVGSKVFLPFEGDSVLSIIISKAMLLAEDTKITDTTIISQIKRVFCM